MVRPKQVSDEEILKTALECFKEYGTGISVQVIADRVGLSQPALFKRFGTKEELILRTLVPSEHLPVVEWLNANPIPGPIRPQLETLLAQVWETLKWIIPRVILLQSSQISIETVFSSYEIPPPIRLLMAISGFVSKAQKRGQIRSDISPEACAQSILGTLQGRAFFQLIIMRTENAEDEEKYLKSTAEILFNGMREKEETP